MTRLLRSHSVLGLMILGVFTQPVNAFACAACFGKSDSAMAQGMNMGIFALLGVVVCVLSLVAGFFIYLARRSAKIEPGPAAVTELSQT
jgi:hypothetical protein